MEGLAVGLIESDYIFLSTEYLNLVIKQSNMFNKKHSSTSSATSGPLLVKFPCLVTDTNVLVSNVTASSESVFSKIM